MDKALVHSIVEYGKRYRHEMLGRYDRDQLLADWRSALDFFLGRVCFQGRGDNISERVYQAVVEVLSRWFRGENGTVIYQQERSQSWKNIKAELRERIGKGKVGKDRDVEMVLSTLDFIARSSSLNIVNYTVQKIQEGKIRDHYYELRHNIVQVGPETAFFYLRDVVSLYGLESEVPEESAFCLQPVDRWVRKLVKKLVNKMDFADSQASDKKIRDAIVALCKKHGCSPVEFNQGAWYVGHFAFDLLLERLIEATVAPHKDRRAC